MPKKLKRGMTFVRTHATGVQQKVRINKIQGVRALCYVHDIVGWSVTAKCAEEHGKSCKLPKCHVPTFGGRIRETVIPTAALEALLGEK